MVALLGSIMYLSTGVHGWDKEKIANWSRGIKKDKVVLAINCGAD